MSYVLTVLFLMIWCVVLLSLQCVILWQFSAHVQNRLSYLCILSLLLHLCCIVSYCILSCLLRNSVGFRKAAVPNPASSPQLCPGKPPALTMRHRSAFLPIQPLASLVRWLRWMLTVIMVLTFAHQELERDHNFMSYRSPVTIKR